MEMLMFPPELLTRKHVAYLLSTSEWGVSQLVRENKLTPVKDGGKWQKFRLEDVRYYIRSLPEAIND
jgi:hypothetical protein